MKKNVASQKIGAQMVAAADGSAFTSAVTVSVTGDAGTQATGSVGSGACTHEGNGYHTYAPAQAETNYDLIAFTFTGTGAIPATVQVFTSFPQTVDNATNISAVKAVTDLLPNAGALSSLATQASVNTIDDFLDTEVAAIKAVTDLLPNAGALTSLATAANLATLSGYVDTEVGAIKAKTDSLTFTVAGQADVNVQSVNNTTILGSGIPGDEWGP